MTFASPAYLLLLLACPALWWLERHRRSQPSGSLGFSLVGAVPDTRRVRLAQNLFWMRIGAVALLSLAMARPQMLRGFEEITSEGIDIVLALDVSGSMAAEDFRPKNRLAVAKDVVSKFISGRRGDRIGLVIFAGISVTKCPLTTDYDVVKSLLSSIELGQIEDGTAIGNGLANCVNRLRHSTVKSKVIILLTDGVNNRGEISPPDAADIARRMKIKVYTIGAGTRGMAPYPIVDPTGGIHYEMLPVQIDEDLLRAIAAKSGGRYFRATDKESLASIYAEIDQLEKSKIESRSYTLRRELFVPAAALGFGLVLMAVVAGETWLRRAY